MIFKFCQLFATSCQWKEFGIFKNLVQKTTKTTKTENFGDLTLWSRSAGPSKRKIQYRREGSKLSNRTLRAEAPSACGETKLKRVWDFCARIKTPAIHCTGCRNIYADFCARIKNYTRDTAGVTLVNGTLKDEWHKNEWPKNRQRDVRRMCHSCASTRMLSHHDRPQSRPQSCFA